MKALQYQRPRQLVLIDIPIPKLQPDEVLIKVKYCGICGTDLHILNEEAPSSPKVILGHEFSGTISEKGKTVKHLSIGDHVTVDPNDHCGHCAQCRNGQVHFCENIKPIGIDKNGGWAEYCKVPVNQVYKLPAEIDLAWGALVEPISCIIHGWNKLKPTSNNQSIHILGAGLIGLLWALILKSFGFNQISISEINNKRLKRAKELGLTANPPMSVGKNTIRNKSGFDYIIDCSGNAQAIEEAFDWLNPMGKFLFFGICPEDQRISIKPFQIFQKELTIFGSVINPFTFSRAIQLIKNIQLPLEKLGIIFFDLSEYKEAIKTARLGKSTKIIFRI